MTSVKLFLSVLVLTTLLSLTSTQDPCEKLTSCPDCVNQPYCGWCSTYVIYNDGTKGKQCAGFDPDHPDTKPFVCHGRYQTTECTPGYVCDYESLKCYETTPGQGDTKEVCEAECIKPPQTYVCDEANFTCIEASPGHGTTFPSCNAHCYQGYGCDVQNLTCYKMNGGAPLSACMDNCGKKSNNTPSDLQGVWRGLQINDKYIAGEWQAKFGADNLTLRFPVKSKIILEGTVQEVTQPSKQLYITITEGPKEFKDKIIRGLYQYVYGPEVRLATLALSAPDGPLPESYDSAMSDSDMTVLVMMQCLNPLVCDFKFGDVLAALGDDEKRALLPDAFNIDPKPTAINDSCMPYNNCPDCIAQKFCGWCSDKVVYNDSTVGSHCAGFNPDNTKKPFVCKGTYSTNQCFVPTAPTRAPPVAPVPPVPSPPVPAPQPPRPSYLCNKTSFQCYQTHPGQGSSKEVCEQSCHPPKNVTPVALLGKWRGLQIDKNYAPGEWKADFKNDSVVITSPMGQVLKGSVAGDASQLWFYLDDGNIIRGMWQVAYGVETKDFGWAWGKLNGPAPTSFAEAMNTEGMTEYEFVSCLKEENCIFDHLDE